MKNLLEITAAALLMFCVGCAGPGAKSPVDAEGMRIQVEASAAAIKINGQLSSEVLTALEIEVAALKSNIDKASAKVRLKTAKEDRQKYDSHSYWWQGLTTAAATITALTDQAVTGGIVTALLGVGAMYNESQQQDKTRASLIDACEKSIAADSTVIDRYYYSWKYQLSALNKDVPVPSDISVALQTESKDIHTQIGLLEATCI